MGKGGVVQSNWVERERRGEGERAGERRGGGVGYGETKWGEEGWCRVTGWKERGEGKGAERRAKRREVERRGLWGTERLDVEREGVVEMRGKEEKEGGRASHISSWLC